MQEYSAEEILEALNTHYDESIFITDSEGTIIYVNKIGAERLGSSRDYLMGKNVRELMKEGMYVNSTVLTAIETKKPYTGHLANYGVNNKKDTVSHSVPVLDNHGKVRMVVTNNMSKERSEEWEEIMRKELTATEKLKREIEYLRVNKNKELISNSPAMRSMINSVNVLAPTDSSVVILGESGTGKDVLANYIHAHSSRASKPFISINCAAIPEDLLESELFGYEKGAFTGALSKGKIGLFEAAEGGTIFLDEIGDMPVKLQSKLLRTLENKEVRRVGGVESIPIDVRIICATNVDLAKQVKEKRFREDLYYRLSVFVLKIPPLRERKEDIMPLAELFLKNLNEKYSDNKRFSEESRETMLSHNWPGNIRELKNVIERIFVISPGRELIFTPKPTANYSEDTLMNSSVPTEIIPLKEYSKKMEEKYIEHVIDLNGGSVAKAAEQLGVHRSAIYRKLGDNVHKL
ncbi:MAG: sigma 54-interacting transcriptional regulator [Lachnospiraceae bacterium]|nr:sigma 54-interacting transcriptional regulator [Lachnospiraceae bacterium]